MVGATVSDVWNPMEGKKLKPIVLFVKVKHETCCSISDTCPKETEECFLPGANPSTYDEKRKELCAKPTCMTCHGICQERHQCLEMRSRRDVVYFGVDEYEDPLMTYYHCVDGGNCTEIYNMTCSRTCDEKKFDFNRANFALLQVSW